SALEISAEVEQFLVPGRYLRTTRPYGTDASYHGMVLARTEISRAHGAATIAASKANPFVQLIDWRVSMSHKDQDECDINAANGPYEPDKVPRYPNHPQD